MEKPTDIVYVPRSASILRGQKIAATGNIARALFVFESVIVYFFSDEINSFESTSLIFRSRTDSSLHSRLVSENDSVSVYRSQESYFSRSLTTILYTSKLTNDRRTKFRVSTSGGTTRAVRSEKILGEDTRAIRSACGW